MPLPFLIPAIMAGSSLLGGLFGNKSKQQQQQNTTTNTNSTTNSNSQFQQNNSNSSLSRPVYDEMQGNLRDTLLQQYMGRLFQQPNDLLESTYYGNMRSINENTNRLKNNVAETYANRGLSYSPASAVAMNNVDANRYSNIINLEGSMPALQDQIMQQRMQQASQYLQSLPVAMSNDSVGSANGTQNSTQNTVGTQTSNTQGTTEQSSGGGIGGGIQSLVTTMAGLYGNGAFGKTGSVGGGGTNTGYNNFGSINPNFVVNSPFRFNSGIRR